MNEDTITDKNITVIKFIRQDTKYRKYFLCKCFCGKEKEIRLDRLNSGTKSCGCLSKASLELGRKPRHGKTGTKVYIAWKQMKSRCLNPKNHAYKRYGYRGITICDKWINSFQNFYKDMGDPPTNRHSIDRRNNNLGYFPENCRWATYKEQTRNYSKNRIYTFNGETNVLLDWSKKLNISYGCLRNRIDRYGWTIEKAFTIPVQKSYHSHTEKFPP